MQGKLLLSVILFIGLSGCSSMSRRTEPAETKSTPAATVEGGSVHEKATPIPSTEGQVASHADDPQVKIDAAKDKKGQVSTKENAKIKLVDKNGKAIAAPAEASLKGGKEMTKVQVPHDQHEAEAKAIGTTTTATAEAHPSSRHAGPVPADKALGWLKNGNTRFVKGSFRNDGASRKDRTRLVAGQQPHTVVLSCSDSRVPPEIIFDQKLGEIFVVRVAGESLDSSSIGSIEYAVEHLGANLILVLGHESCGAVKAALGTLDGSGLGSPALNGLIADLRPRLMQFKDTKPSAGFLEESWANVDGVAKDLLERSEIIRDGVASGEVKVTRAVYHLDSGAVEWH